MHILTSVSYLSACYLCRMDYFKRLLDLLKIEKEEDRWLYKELTENMPVTERRANGMTWYPVAIKDTEVGRGDYLTVEVERTTHHDVIHQLRFGMTAAIFSNHNSKADRVEGTVSYIGGNRLKISLRTDELPEWSRDGKLGIDAVFDKNSYDEMENVLKLASAITEKKDEGQLIKILTGEKQPTYHTLADLPFIDILNENQQKAVEKILEENELAIVQDYPPALR